MFCPEIQRFSIFRSFGIGKANFGFWDAADGFDEDVFYEESFVTELVLHSKVRLVRLFHYVIARQVGPTRYVMTEL